METLPPTDLHVIFHILILSLPVDTAAQLIFYLHIFHILDARLSDRFVFVAFSEAYFPEAPRGGASLGVPTSGVDHQRDDQALVFDIVTVFPSPS